MKKLYSLFVLFSVLGFVGCTTNFEEDDVVVDNGTTTLVLQIADHHTKIALGDKDESGNYSVYWNEDDQISVNGITSTKITINSDNASAAVFEFGDPNLEKPYKILYPASQNDNVTFATTQNYYEGGFEPGTAPFYGYMERGLNGKLGHLSGVLRFSLVGNDDTTTLASMTVKAESGYIAGEYAVDFTNGKLTALEGGSSTLNYSFGEGLKLSSEAEDFFLVLPCGEYGICSAELRTTDNRVMLVRFKTSGSSAIKAGVVREFAEITFKAGMQCELLPLYCEEDEFIIDDSSYTTPPTTVDGDYLVINNKHELMWLCYNGAVVGGVTYNKVRLGENIDMEIFSSIALPSIKLNAGDEFDGNNKTITGLNMAEEASSIFGDVDNLNIHDLTLVDCSVNTAVHTGAGILVGMVSNGLTVNNVTFNNCSVVAPRKIGLVAGALHTGTFNISNVTANGGLVETSYASGKSGQAGGLVGCIAKNGDGATTSTATFTNCRTSTTVKSYMEATNTFYGKMVGQFGGYNNDEKLYFVNCDGTDATLVPLYDKGSKNAETAVLSINEAYRADFCTTTLNNATNDLLGGERYCRGMIHFEGNRFFYEWDGKRTATMIKDADGRNLVYSPFDLAKAQGTSYGDTTGIVFMTSVDMGGHTFKPINYVRYLDGGGFELHNLKVVRTHDATNNRGAGLIIYSTGTTTHENITIVGADITCNHDASLPALEYGNDEDGATGNAYAGVLVSRVASGTYTASNVTVRNSKVRGVCKVGGLIGVASAGSTTISNCSVDGSIVENYDPKVANYYKMETTSSGMVIDGLQWWYTAGECGGLIGFLNAKQANISNCSVTNTQINCTGQPNKDVVANIWDESKWTAGAYKSGVSIRGNATTTIAGRHINQFIGDIRSLRTETQQENGTGEYTTTISNYTVSGNSYNGVSADSTNNYNHEYASGQYCPVVGCAYYTGVDVKILVNIHVSHCAGTLNFNANGGATTTLTEGIGSGNNMSWFGGNSKNVNIGIFSNNGTSYYPAAPTE